MAFPSSRDEGLRIAGSLNALGRSIFRRSAPWEPFRLCRSTHHEAHHDDKIAGIGQTEGQFLIVGIEHFDHLQGGMIRFQVAFGAVGQIQEYIAMAHPDLFNKLLHVGNLQNLNHVYLPFMSDSFQRPWLYFLRKRGCLVPSPPDACIICRDFSAVKQFSHQITRF
jgi:hypothetical protein